MSVPSARLLNEAPRLLSGWMVRSYRRPIGLFLGLVVVPIAMVIAFTHHLHERLWRQQLMDNLRVTATLGAEIVQETLQETIEGERMISVRPEFASALAVGERDRLRELLKGALPLLRRAASVAVLSAEGKLLAAVPDATDEGFIGSAPSQNWQPDVSPVYLREGLGIEKVVSVAFPVLRGETLIGFIEVRHRIESIKSWIQKLRIEPSGFLYVVDQKDQLVVFPYQVTPGMPMVVSQWPPVAIEATREGRSLTFRSHRDGAEWMAGVAAVGSTGWRVIAVQEQEPALRTVRRAIMILTLMAVILLALVAAVGSRWLRLHAFSLRLMDQTVKLLREEHQRQLLTKSRKPPRRTRGGRS